MSNANEPQKRIRFGQEADSEEWKSYIQEAEVTEVIDDYCEST